MFTFDRSDLQRITVSVAGAVLLALLSVAGVATAADQAARSTTAVAVR